MGRPRYGFDAPFALVGLVGAAVVLLAGGIVTGLLAGWLVALVPLLLSAYFAACSVIYVHTTRAGKFAVWREVLDDLPVRGDERVLDLGCGRGAVLIEVARRLRTGHATGADLWRSVDQSGNAPEVTRANAEAAGVSDRVSLDTADMTALPYPDASFDLVVSSMAIHNIHPARRRLVAIDEALRVLAPGGRLVIADISAARSYQRHLAARGVHATLRSLGWRMWWGAPWLPTLLLTAQ